MFTLKMGKESGRILKNEHCALLLAASFLLCQPEKHDILVFHPNVWLMEIISSGYIILCTNITLLRYQNFSIPVGQLSVAGLSAMCSPEILKVPISYIKYLLPSMTVGLKRDFM